MYEKTKRVSAEMNNYQEILQKYFSDELNGEEQQLFNTLKENNKEFIELLKEHEDMRAAFQILEDKEVSNFIKTIENKQNNKNTFLKIAAALTIFISGYYFLFYSNNNYESYLEEYPNVHYPITRGAAENNLYKAFSAYERKDYNLAIQQFDSLLTKNKTPEIQFYKAMALLNIDKKEKALAILQNLEKVTFEYTEETLWYLSITNALLNNKTLAKAYLMKMDKKNMKFKQKDRKELLEKLK